MSDRDIVGSLSNEPSITGQLQPDIIISGKMDARFPASVTVLSPILLDRAGANYQFSLDLNAIYEDIYNNFPVDGLRIARVVARDTDPSAQYTEYVCDGTADQVQINAAISDANAAGGGRVIVLDGAYSLTGPIVMKDNVHLIGGPATNCVAASTFTTSSGMINCGGISNFIIEGMGIDGRTNNKATNGIVCAPALLFTTGDLTGTPCSNYTIRNNRVKVRKGHSYHIWNVRSRDFAVRDNWIDGGYTSADTFTAVLEQEGIECVGTKRGTIEDNSITGVGNVALNFPSFTDLSDDMDFAGMIVTGNKIKTSGTGLLSYLYSDGDTGDVGGMCGCLISGNTFDDVYVNGIAIEVLDVAGFDGAVPFQDNIIANNTVAMAASGQPSDARGLALNNQHSDVSAIVSVGNVIQGNVIRNCLNTNFSGRVALVFWTGFRFVDNEVVTVAQGSGNAAGLYIPGCEDFQCSRNTVSGARNSGINLQGCKRWVVSDNDVREWNSSDAGYGGLRIEAFTGVGATDGDARGNRFKTATFATVPALVTIAASSDEINYLDPDNAYVGAEYGGGAIVSNASSGTFNRGVSGWSDTNLVSPDARYARTGATNTFTATQVVQSSDAGALPGPVFALDRASVSPAAADYIGSLLFVGRDSGGNSDSYAQITSRILDPADGAEAGTLEFGTALAGSVGTRFNIATGAYMQGSSDPGAGNFAAGALRSGAGSVGSPAVRIGSDTVGWANVSGSIVATLDGSTQALLLGSTGITLSRSGGGVSTVNVSGEGATQLTANRYSTNTSAASFELQKARGTISSPTAPAQNDQLGNFSWNAWTGSTFATSALLRATVRAATPSASDLETEMTLFACAAGSASVTELLGARHSQGLKLFGTAVIDQNRHHLLRSYTVATLPATPAAGSMAYCSDETGGAVPVFGDGTNWRRVTDRAVAA